MYQAGLEWILGFRLRGTTLLLDPCIPRAWPGYEIDFRYHSARYEIVVENPHGVSRGVVASASVDGQPSVTEPRRSRSSTMAATHRVRVVLGRAVLLADRYFGGVQPVGGVPGGENSAAAMELHRGHVGRLRRAIAICYRVNEAGTGSRR